MSDDAPASPADPRGNGEPYYIDTDCPKCGESLVLYDSLTDEQRRSSGALSNPDANPTPDEPWHDEWVCPNCLDGVHMDWPTDTDTHSNQDN